MSTVLPPRDAAAGQQAVAALIGAIGDAAFAQRALAALNDPLQVASWSVYRLHGDRAPVLHLSATQGPHDVTQSAFAA